MADLARLHAEIGVELAAAVKRVLDSGRYVHGPEVVAFEMEAARYLGARHAIAVSSGTDALVCALTALGVERDHEVVTTPFTFVATAEAIVRCGAKLRFGDIERETLNLDAARAAKARVVVPVHLFGNPCDMTALRELDAAVVEDAAQAFGARWEGRAVGTYGALGCFSFFPAKVLGAFGDAGLITTDDDELAEQCRVLRQHGCAERHLARRIGGNFRMDALQAALLRVKLPKVDSWISRRREHANAYRAALSEIPGLETPTELPGAYSVYGSFALRVLGERRDALSAFLAECGIASAIHYPLPLHLQPAFASLGHRVGDFPEAERAAREVLSLPVHESLTDSQRDRVIDRVRAFFAR